MRNRKKRARRSRSTGLPFEHKEGPRGASKYETFRTTTSLINGAKHAILFLSIFPSLAFSFFLFLSFPLFFSLPLFLLLPASISLLLVLLRAYTYIYLVPSASTPASNASMTGSCRSEGAREGKKKRKKGKEEDTKKRFLAARFSLPSVISLLFEVRGRDSFCICLKGKFPTREIR